MIILMNRKAVIFGLKGINLTNKEKIFLKKINHGELFYFSRNIKNFIS